MKRSSILAHRGLFLTNDEKNTVTSLQRALDQGFGIETDIRDLDAEIVISHDPPYRNNNITSIEWLLEYLSLNRMPSRIALNIKSDGLAKKLSDLVGYHNILPDNLFVFDMSVPDGLKYIENDIPTYSRVSEYEREPSCLHSICGIWVDNFTGAFPQVKIAQSFLDMGLRTALVSSELHGRDYRGLWADILSSGIYKHPLFELCTDFPIQAAQIFSISGLYD